MLGEDGRLDSLAGCVESREIIFRQWPQIASGLLVFALGVHLTIYANIGMAPGRPGRHRYAHKHCRCRCRHAGSV